jgi:cobalt/nickel transport system permease protein
MHMADSLISVAVGGAMIAASAGAAAYSVKKVNKSLDDKKVPLMAVMGAFIFAAQMINFSIPGTGSSGHLAGALILSIILGPHAAFLTMSSVLIIQALFFADGGLLALGCNIFNMGFFTCFVAYPLIYKPLAGNKQTFSRIMPASLLASIAGLQLGAFCVVIQTLLSGITELPFGKFLLLMQPIHLAIGVVEGIVTTAVVMFVKKARPEILQNESSIKAGGKAGVRSVVITMAAITVIIAGLVSWYASSDPDGLEWSIFKTAGQEELTSDSPIHSAAAKIQEKTSVMPDYSLKGISDPEYEDLGTSAAGLIGAAVLFILLGIAGTAVVLVRKKKTQKCREAG